MENDKEKGNVKNVQHSPAPFILALPNPLSRENGRGRNNLCVFVFVRLNHSRKRKCLRNCP